MPEVTPPALSPSPAPAALPALPQATALPPTSVSKSRTPIAIALVFLLIGLLVGAVVVYVYLNNPKPATTQTPPPVSSPVSQTPTSTPVTATTPVRQHIYSSTDKWYGTSTYPDEILALYQDEVLTVNCTKTYASVYNYTTQSSTYVDTDGKAPDAETLQARTAISANHSGFAETSIKMSKCKVADKTFYVYNLCIPKSDGSGCGGGIGATHGLMYFTLAELHIEFPNTTGPYSSCLEVLAYTQTGIVYLNCKAGDGGGSATEIYKLDLGKHTATSIKKLSNP